MSIKKEEIAIWLRDAYVTKARAVASLEKQVSEYPHLEENIKEHLEETKQHVELFRDCLCRYGYSSSIRVNMTKRKPARRLKPYPTDMAFVRDVHSSYSLKEDSVPSYEAIKEAAKGLGDRETVKVCDRILRDEKKTEDWRLAVGVVAKEI